MFFILAIGNGLVLNIVFDEKVTNKLTSIILFITALLVSILWAKLSIKAEFSIFEHKLPSSIKKKELSKRGISILVFYVLLKAIRSAEVSNNLFLVISKRLIEFSFAVTILILIGSFIIIVLKKSRRR